LRTSVRLAFECSETDVGGRLRSVLAPDNEGIPRGLAFTMGGSGKEVSFEVESTSPSTALATCLALLRDVSLFQEVWLLSRPSDSTPLRVNRR
jgi:hypothetical protein